MNKVIGKKFLSCLCAFASSISMSFAVVNDNKYCAPIVPCPAALINVRTSTEKVIEKLSKLSGDNVCVVCVIDDKVYSTVGCLLSVSLIKNEGFHYFRFILRMNKCVDAGGNADNYVDVGVFDVYAGYIVERLGIAEEDVPDNGSLQNFIDSGENRFKFSRLFLEDVLGMKLDEGYYPSDSTSTPYNSNINGGVMTKKSHPDYNGCFWRYFKKNIYDVFTKDDVNLLGKVLSAEDVGNSAQFGGVDQKGIHEHFFGTPEKPKMTSYYKAMINVRWSAGAKAGVIVPTSLFLVLAGVYTGERFLIEPMKDRALSASFASLRNENGRLKIDADKVRLYETFCGKTGAGREIRKQVERKFEKNSTKVQRQNRFIPKGDRGRVRRSRNW